MVRNRNVVLLVRNMPQGVSIALAWYSELEPQTAIPSAAVSIGSLVAWSYYISLLVVAWAIPKNTYTERRR